ncbi:dihydroxyacetone kinase phosphoryl donor subunit DhaM [uncultured Amnibacterium sp.]|uniref:dihydroxyacetone kinase phosphoryl donor subunit DhaM n=1 Tax=uncultured Amnibacterium sp. TaxID=1631851 RepID=UPI0035CBBFCF
MPVGVVFVSHSARIAEGVVELAGQMAPNVALIAAGGTDEGGIGTSYDKVLEAIGGADGGQGVLLIGDLGSAILTAETAVDLLDQAPTGGIRVLDVPIVEGGVAAAVAAESGADLDAVARAATGEPPALAAVDGPARATVVIADPEGLHARPAAALVRLVAGFDARVTVNGADASSLLRVIALGLRRDEEVTVRGSGAEAQQAVDAVVALLAGSAR